MEFQRLRDAITAVVGTGNTNSSPFLHCSKNIYKVLSLAQERKHLYSGEIVEIDVSAASLDCVIDLGTPLFMYTYMYTHVYRVLRFHASTLEHFHVLCFVKHLHVRSIHGLTIAVLVPVLGRLCILTHAGFFFHVAIALLYC